jgi:hypothetical protein
VLPRQLPVAMPQVPFSGYQGLVSRAPTRYPRLGRRRGEQDETT